jgi:hypothetical protein
VEVFHEGDIVEYAPKAVRDWFARTLGINGTPAKGELLTHCPECGSDVFYFNFIKQVGVCHKAQCGFTPTLRDLIDLVGYAPDQTGFWEAPQVVDLDEPEVEMPGLPVLHVLQGEMMTPYPDAVDYLRSRGIPDDITLNWGITSDGERVFVPIKEGGMVRNFNSRLLPGHLGRKYLYSPGAKTKTHILGWEECELWDHLGLIENTFVSLSMRRGSMTSTVFGSSLSDEQADMIAKSRIKHVGILWDENTEKKSEKAVKKLHARGVKAAFWIIKGQPDDHPVKQVAEWAEMVYTAAQEGTDYIDLRGE